MKSEDEEHGQHCHKATNVIILGKTFLTGDDAFTFQDDQGRKYGGKRSNFYVSKFAFIERCAIVVMGFPFGGINMVSLRTQRPYSFFMAEGVIEDCAIQDADDDPRGFFYLWFALSRGDKAHALSAYAVFQEEVEKRKCYDKPQFGFSINFTLSDFMSFLSLKTMLVDCSRLAVSPKDTDASINESIVSNIKSSSLAIKKHFAANLSKCRYIDVPCWDKIRIVLSWPPGGPNNFVRANRISHELFETQKFIYCQGPLL